MSGVNRVFLIGNLGADPERKELDGGKVVAKFSVATTRKWKDRTTGEDQERTEWHRIVAWGNVGEAAAKYLRKGSKVCVQGRIQTRKWTNDQGQDRYFTEVVAEDIEFLGPAAHKAAA